MASGDTTLAGPPLTADELTQAQWSSANGKAVGVMIRDGAVRQLKTQGSSGTAYVPLRSGVLAIGFAGGPPDAGDMRVLAALIGLADLLLDRRRAGVESERAKELEASDRLKAAILSSLSHELKSPLASLRAGLTALTSPQAGLQPEQTELLGDMDRQASRLDHMVGELLALSRLEAGVGLDPQSHSFSEIVGVSMRHLRAELKGHRVSVRIPEGLPDVNVDELQLGRVITNLLENAADWAPAGGSIEISPISRWPRPTRCWTAIAVLAWSSMHTRGTPGR